MNALYEATRGSTSATVNMWTIGEGLGWNRSDTDHTVEYLEAEHLLESVAMGGTIGITHAGVVEVEASISHPDDPTEHFPAMNVITIGQMIGSQIQQGSVGSTQELEFMKSDAVAELLELIPRLREEVLPAIELGPEDQDALETELDVTDRYLRSKRPQLTAVRHSVEQVCTLLGKATVIVGSSVQLAQWTAKLLALVSGA